MVCGGGNKDVDAIWQRLQQQQAGTCDRTKLEALWRHVQRGSTTSEQPPTKHPAVAKQLWQLQSSSERSSNSKTQHICDAPKGSLQDAPAINKLTLALQSSDGSTVKAALQELQAILADAAAGSTHPTAKLGKALLRCFEHRAEACRDLAVTCFKSILQLDPDGTLGMLPYALPVLGERLQCDEARNPAEPCEEVRLALVQLLSMVLEQAGSAVAAYVSEVWSMLTAVLADSFHEVAMQGCRVAQQLAGALGYRLGNISKELVAALLPLTTHKRYRVRIMAIEAIRDVVHHGAHDMILEMVAWRDPNVVPISAFYGDEVKVNFCGKLATDHHVQVRLAFLDMIGNWMLTLRERRDHEPRLLPYVLSGLCDEADAVVDAAQHLLDQLGQQYEQEHEKELADLVRFADKLEGEAEARLLQCTSAGTISYAGSWDVPIQSATAQEPASSMEKALQGSEPSTAAAAWPRGQHVLPYPQLSSAALAAAAVAAAAAGAASSTTANMKVPFVLPGPFKQRARLGSRLLVRGSFSSLLPALCRELSAWQSGPRAMSARLLLVSLVLAESASEQQLQVILPALCASAGDAEAGAAIRDCATVLGCFCSLPLLLNLLEPRLAEWASTPQRQAAGLSLLPAILRGSGALERIAGHGSKLLQLLLDLDLAGSRDSSVRLAAEELVQQLLVPHTFRQVSTGSSCVVLCGQFVGDEPAAAQQTTCCSSGSGTDSSGSTIVPGSSGGSHQRGAIECQAGACRDRRQLLSGLDATAAAGTNAAGTAQAMLAQLLEQLQVSDS